MVGYFSETVIANWILWSHCELGQEGFYDTRFQCHVMQRVSVAKVRNLRAYTDEITHGMFGKLWNDKKLLLSDLERIKN